MSSRRRNTRKVYCDTCDVDITRSTERRSRHFRPRAFQVCFPWKYPYLLRASHNLCEYCYDTLYFWTQVHDPAMLPREMRKMRLEEIDDSWWPIVCPEFRQDYFPQLAKIIAGIRGLHEVDSGTYSAVYPPADEVFSWTKYCRPDEVKVVIVGQDPYHKKGEANGLAFSNQKKVSPSLRKIFKMEGFDPLPQHGDLSSWARQGVLLLNRSLTVTGGDAGSHADFGWRDFTSAVVKNLCHESTYNGRDLIFLLWGGDAKELKKDITECQGRHVVLESYHPTSRKPKHVTEFLECKHFELANIELEESGQRGINWSSVCDEFS